VRCTQCDAEIVSVATFCHQCGFRLTESEPGRSPQDLLRSPGRGNNDDPPEQELWQGKFSQLAMIGSWL
jgi:hypothetical protein